MAARNNGYLMYDIQEEGPRVRTAGSKRLLQAADLYQAEDPWQGQDGSQRIQQGSLAMGAVNYSDPYPSPGVLLQNATLGPPADLFLPGACSEPANVTAAGSLAYGDDLADYPYPVGTQSDFLSTDFLADEDLRLMDLMTSPSELSSVPYPVQLTFADNSSDTGVSSMCSERVLSAADDCDPLDSGSECSGGTGEAEGCGFVGARGKYGFYGRGSAAASVGSPRGAVPVRRALIPEYSQQSEAEVLAPFGSYPATLPGGLRHPRNGAGNCERASDDSFGSLSGAEESHLPSPVRRLRPPHPGHGRTAAWRVAYRQEVAVQHNHSYSASEDGSGVPCASSSDGGSPCPPDGRLQVSPSAEDRARASRDEKRARALALPLSNEDIVNLPIEEFNEKLSRFELTDDQLALIRDIRRRGKNKVAAQNCRKRKLDQICTLQQDVELLHLERQQLEQRHESLLALRHAAREKYQRLCRLLSDGPHATSTAEQRS